MGQCNYYLQARFRTAKAAGKARAKLALLMAEGQRAYDYWQSFRGIGAAPAPSAEAFWGHFRREFPQATHYLKETAGVREWWNGLAGLLGCLVDPADPRRARLEQGGEVLRLTLYNIWHFSELDLLERVLTEDLGAVAVNYASEEDLEHETDFDPEGDDPFDFIPV